jgi:hypothetical protein
MIDDKERLVMFIRMDLAKAEEKYRSYPDDGSYSWSRGWAAGEASMCRRILQMLGVDHKTVNDRPRRRRRDDPTLDPAVKPTTQTGRMKKVFDRELVPDGD